MLGHRRRRWPSQSVRELQGEFVERPGASGDGRPAVAEIDVVEHEGGDLGDPGGVDRREGEDEPRRRRQRSRDEVLELLGEEKLQHGVLVLPDLDSAGGVAENQPLPFGPGEQGPLGSELVTRRANLLATRLGSLQASGELTRCRTIPVIVASNTCQPRLLEVWAIPPTGARENARAR